jgi:lipopolysaccharide transport system ATP-binding protein
MQDVETRQGRTVLFVSHNMVAVQSLCRKALLLANGRVVEVGPTANVITRYLEEKRDALEEQHWSSPQTAPGSDYIRIKGVRVVGAGGTHEGLLTTQTALQIETEYWVIKNGATTHLTYHLINDQGIVVLTSGSPPVVRERGLYRAVCQLPGNLLNSGGFFLKLLLVQNENHVTYQRDNIATFRIVDIAERAHASMSREPGVVQPLLKWETARVSTPMVHLEAQSGGR